MYVNSEEPARWSEQRKALSHWLEEDLSAQEIEELNLIKAMVTINPMGEPEDGDWGGGRSGRSNGGRSDGDWGDGRRSRARHSRSFDWLYTPYWSLLLLEVAPRWRRRPRRWRARPLEVA